MMRISAFAVVLGLLFSGGAQAAGSLTIDYDTLASLPYNAQKSYLDAFQDVLVEMDSSRSGSHAALDWMLGQILCSADANARGPFCINLGVVQEEKDCPKEFHDFDTAKYFKDHGLGISSCSKTGAMPCSPFFGFQADGNLYCSVPHSTFNCERQSKRGKTTALVDVISGCALDGKTDHAKIDCKELKNFVNDQTKIVNRYCATSSKACGVLRDQKKAYETAKDNLDPAVVVEISKYLDDANTKQPVLAAKPKCPPDAPAPPASAPAPVVKTEELKPAATTADKNVGGLIAPAPAPSGARSACTQPEVALKDHPNTAEDQDMVEVIQAGFEGSSATCARVKSPTGVVLSFDRMPVVGTVTSGLIVYPPGPDGKTPLHPPVALDSPSIQVMETLSKTFEGKSYGFDSKDLMRRYLPIEAIKKSPTDMVVGKTKIPAVQYETEDGTIVRYTLDATGSQYIALTFKGKKETPPTYYSVLNRLPQPSNETRLPAGSKSP